MRLREANATRHVHQWEYRGIVDVYVSEPPYYFRRPHTFAVRRCQACIESQLVEETALADYPEPVYAWADVDWRKPDEEQRRAIALKVFDGHWKP